MGGRAGTGKSALALCAGLEAVMERRQHRKVIVFRPLYPVGGQDLGYLPGSEAEKMGPWAQAVYDTLSSVTTQEVIDELVARDMFEVLPLTHIRGRSLHDAFVIVDEAQSLERGVLLTVLSRIGTGSRVVLTHDIAQRDNLRVGTARRRDRGDREAQGPPAVRARDPDPLRALRDRRPRHRPSGGHPAVARATDERARVPKLLAVTGVMHNDQNRHPERTGLAPQRTLLARGSQPRSPPSPSSCRYSTRRSTSPSRSPPCSARSTRAGSSWCSPSARPGTGPTRSPASSPPPTAGSPSCPTRRARSPRR